MPEAAIATVADKPRHPGLAAAAVVPIMLE
jgi:hypothetical protein